MQKIKRWEGEQPERKSGQWEEEIHKRGRNTAGQPEAKEERLEDTRQWPPKRGNSDCRGSGKVPDRQTDTRKKKGWKRGR